ncbi:MAG: Holliday junction resolvase RuvX, partial [Christensenellales bacterium]
MRKIALDVGDVRIGIASSDVMGIIAGGFVTYTRVNEEADLDYIVGFAKEMQADTIVV